MPGEPVLEEDFGIDRHGAVEPLSYYAEQLEQRHQRKTMLNGLEDIGRAVKNDDIDQARSLCRQLASDTSGEFKAKDLNDDLEDRAERYTTPQHGVSGIESPWDWLDLKMSGHEDGEMNAYVARRGVGKTWLLCIQAVRALENGEDVIFFSTEMSKEQIARRIDSLVTAIDDSVLKNGEYDNEERLIEQMGEQYSSDGRIWMVGTEEFRTTEDVTAITETFQPDMVLLDGIYRVRPMQSFQKLNGKIGSAAEEIKDMALRTSIPVNITHQLGSDAENRDRVGILDDIAWTSRLQWECDWVIGMDPHDFDPEIDEGTPDSMDVQIMKHRNADLSDEELHTVVNWDLPYDWTEMEFEGASADEEIVSFE
jgi:replicative DNA helicase